VFKNQDAQGRYKWELKFTNFTGTGANGLPNGAKNFKDTLPDGQYFFAVYARAMNNYCEIANYPVTITNAKNVTTGPCQEDLFRGGTSPKTGSVIDPTQSDPAKRTVSATYYDETKPFTPPDNATEIVKKRALTFIRTNPDGSQTTLAKYGTASAPGFTASPIDGPIAGASHEYQWTQTYSYVFPNDGSLANGQYTFEIQVYDSDQNKTGGDCGYAKWTVNFSSQGFTELIG
jgi:hypothetical protein